MTEILTESFCERCGTRYTFESVTPRQRRLGGIRVLGRGLKNFVLSDDSSLDEAMAAARSDEERDATSQQLDAFHRTFNFCMSCRQYTCRDCWNATEARCLSCAPLPGAELHAGQAELDHPSGPLLELDAARLRRIGVPTEPPISRAEPEMIGVAEATAHAESPTVEIEPATPIKSANPAEIAPTEAAAPDEMALATQADAAPGGARATETGFAFASDAEPSIAAAVDAASEAAGAARSEVGVPAYEPGTSLDDAIAAYEAAIAEAALAEPPVAEPAASGGPGVDVIEQPTWDTHVPVEAISAPVSRLAEAAVEPVVEPAPGLGLTPANAEPGLVPAAEPEPVPVAEPEPAPSAEPPVRAPGSVAEAPTAAPAAPQWPTGPRWPTGMPARPPITPPASEVQPLTAVLARGATEAMWAASSRDVVQPVAAALAPAGGVQPCVNCGISLSATARFCRRCGTSQLG